ncbi:DUF6768 family protein [Algimonas porphyrae]|uniref:Uncharacterized protein n=1 Tax=Algimonas porphyrae TaxID=1128113 RepID=A0ABQ5V1N5_9PROT|nr:DUF6768 family protein [Algimonas porphyrae]GLQ20594.1 hypothetical protein GCM10007854_15490 [Algimonas porphyrae]
MTDFDTELKALLSAEDEAFIGDAIDETGYYQYAWSSFRGPGSGMRIMAWGGILLFGSLTILFLWLMFTEETMRVQINFAALAVMANSAQIALKLWFNMQLNRGALSRELRRLQLVVASRG